MTEERQAVSERAIRWRVVRPWEEGDGEAGEFEEGEVGIWMRVWDWCITTTMKKANATQNQRPHTERYQLWIWEVRRASWELTLNYSETHVEGSFGEGA